MVGAREERGVPHAGHRGAHAGLDVPEALHRPGGPQAGVVLQFVLELVFGEGRHAALGVLHDDDLAGVQFALADGERADGVVGHDTAGIAQDVRFAVLQAEDVEHFDAGVHAGDDRQVQARHWGVDGRRTPQRRVGVSLQQFVDGGHGPLPDSGGRWSRPRPCGA